VPEFSSYVVFGFALPIFIPGLVGLVILPRFTFFRSYECIIPCLGRWRKLCIYFNGELDSSTWLRHVPIGS